MKAIILAAGQGKRIPKVTKNKPKCLIKINKISLIERQISFLHKLNINDIIIVKGFKKKKISIKKVKYIINKNYKNNEQLDSLFTARNEFKDDMIVLFSDIIYDFSILKKIYNEEKKIITLAIDKNWKKRYKFRFDHPEEQADKVRINKKGRIIKINKNLKVNETNGEFLGIFKVSKEGCKVFLSKYKKYKKKINTSKKQIHNYLQFLVNEDVNISSKLINGKYMEIDTFNDYKIAKQLFERKNA